MSLRDAVGLRTRTGFLLGILRVQDVLCVCVSPRKGGINELQLILLKVQWNSVIAMTREQGLCDGKCLECMMNSLRIVW